MGLAFKFAQCDVKATAMPPPEFDHACQANVAGSRLTDDEARAIFRILDKSIQVNTHDDLLDWLQGEVQAYLPHGVLLVAWGDFASDAIHAEVISRLPGIRTDRIDERPAKLILSGFFAQWLGCDRAPIAVPAPDDLHRLIGTDSSRIAREAPRGSVTVLMHGIRDLRCRHDCLYALVGDRALSTPGSCGFLALLLPYLDSALRRIALRAAQCQSEVGIAVPVDENHAEAPSFDLSPREAEVLRWVGRGKTNHEIGVILDISTFTVKNHLQRTFRKLNVMNRAQAVALLRVSHVPVPARPGWVVPGLSPRVAVPC